MVGRWNPAAVVLFADGVDKRQVGALEADTLDLAVQQPLQRLGHCKQRESNAR